MPTDDDGLYHEYCGLEVVFKIMIEKYYTEKY